MTEGQHQFKRRDNDQCTFSLSQGAGNQLFWHVAKIALLKTRQFSFINKIRPQAIYKGRMCNNC